MDATEIKTCKEILEDIKNFLNELEKAVEKKAEELGIKDQKKINEWKMNKRKKAISKLSID